MAYVLKPLSPLLNGLEPVPIEPNLVIVGDMPVHIREVVVEVLRPPIQGEVTLYPRDHRVCPLRLLLSARPLGCGELRCTKWGLFLAHVFLLLSNYDERENGCPFFLAVLSTRVPALALVRARGTSVQESSET